MGNIVFLDYNQYNNTLIARTLMGYIVLLD